MNIQVGDYWSRLSYGKIIEINGLDVVVENEDGMTWMIGEELIKREFNLASSTENNKKVNSTELIQLVLSNPGIVMTVNFNKKVKEEDITKMIVSTTADNITAAKTLAKQILQGEERTIIGRHIHQIDSMGRLQFVDMEIEKEIKVSKKGERYDVRMRKVDPRTINWVIINNVKYLK